MKTKHLPKIASALLMFAILTAQPSAVFAQGTAFTYQGRLDSGANPANGSYNMTFSLFNGLTGGLLFGQVTNLDVSVSNGLFIVTEDFGAVINGSAYWLEIAVATNGSTSYTTLTPRQALTPVPSAVYAEVAGSNPLISASGFQNFFGGAYAGTSPSPGSYNTGVGVSAMRFGSGNYNSALGYAALDVNTGSFNSAMGYESLENNAGGDANTGDGVFTLEYNTTGGNNTALGADAMAYNISGSFNTAVGQGALENNTNGNYNVAIGGSAMALGVGGSEDTAVGYQALHDNSTGYQNTATGYGAMSANTTGSYNTANGVGALGQSVADTDNAAFGTDALGFNNGGSYNSAFGTAAMGLSTTGNKNTACGYAALGLNGAGNDNTAVGYYAAGGATGGSSGNTALGDKAIYSLTTGYNNVAAGFQALYANASGFDNIGIGVDTFQANAGSQNTAVGTYAFQLTTSGSGNIGLGYTAGKFLTSGNNNIYIGNAGNSSESGIIRIGTPGTQTLTYIAGTIENPSCNNITITGGSDLAEPFNITTADQPVSAGEVVVIDEANPGQLRLTDQPYDTHVAGVVSGANGIHPGIQMHQEGVLDGGKNVALSGRVYVQADTSNGAIKPGDLLTTSSTPGRAMKVSDHARAQGAILGKAMTGLNEGQGMVLVLVTLQ
jgi:hypothetical protein